MDTLNGGPGDDTITGGPDVDILTGGLGKDLFVFANPGDGPDTLIDFTPHVDQILVDAGSFGGGLAPGPLPADRLISGSDPVPVASGDGVFLYDTDDGALAWDGDGAGGNAAVTLAFLINLPALSESDLLIV